MFVSTCIIN